jgi:hypothetical protein
MPTLYLARAELGAARAGLAAAVRYRAVDLDGAEVIAATGAGVAESAVPGCYHVLGGLLLPEQFAGRLLWSADGGATWLAEEGVDLRLASLVWAHAPRTLTQVVAMGPALPGGAGSLHALRGDTLQLALAGLGPLMGRQALWLTVKERPEEPDAAALLQLREGQGLLVLAGAPGVPEQGVLAVTDEETGGVVVRVEAVATALLAAGSYVWDLQAALPGGVVTLAAGSFTVTADVTRAVAW